MTRPLKITEHLLENLLQQDVKSKYKPKTADEEKPMLLRQEDVDRRLQFKLKPKYEKGKGEDLELGRPRSMFRGGCSRVGILLLSYVNYFTTIVFMVILSGTKVFIKQPAWTLAISVIEFIAVALLDSYLGRSCLRSQCFVNSKR